MMQGQKYIKKRKYLAKYVCAISGKDLDRNQ